MTDGARGNEAFALSDDAIEVDLYAHASRASAKPAARKLCLADFAEWLPQLGPVFWLQHYNAKLNKRAPNQCPATSMFDHPALSALTACARLRAHHTITARGPREWLCFCSADGTIEARLFLLPDTNVLAWDEMTAALRIAISGSDCHEPPTHKTLLGRALRRLGQRWQAQFLEFKCVQRPRPGVLDAQPPLRISLLGIEIAHNIVRDEYAEWVSPLHPG